MEWDGGRARLSRRRSNAGAIVSTTEWEWVIVVSLVWAISALGLVLANTGALP